MKLVLKVLCAVFFMCLGAVIAACEAVASVLCRRREDGTSQKSDSTQARAADASARPEPNNNLAPVATSQQDATAGDDQAIAPAHEWEAAARPDQRADSAPVPEARKEDAIMSTIVTPVSKLAVRVAGATHVGLVRAHNEDAFFIAADQQVFLVADGMGGHSSGEVASSIVTRVFGDDLREAGAQQWPCEDDVRDKLVATISRADNDIKAHAFANRHCHGMGTTVVAAARLREEVHVAHAGDSRAYRLRGGRLEQLTRDHSLVSELIEQGRLKPEEAENFAHKSVITRALGQKGNNKPDHLRFEPQQGDVLLLCSDGLSGVVPDSRIAEILAGANQGNLDDVCRQLIDETLAGGAPDNVTVVIAVFC
jgi:protein phosphatase